MAGTSIMAGTYTSP